MRSTHQLVLVNPRNGSSLPLAFRSGVGNAERGQIVCLVVGQDIITGVAYPEDVAYVWKHPHNSGKGERRFGDFPAFARRRPFYVIFSRGKRKDILR